MKALKHFQNQLLYGALLFGSLLFGCKRDIPPLPINKTEELKEVTFRLSGFNVDVLPMEVSGNEAKLAFSNVGMDVQSLLGLTPNPEPQFLYYWSFNEESTMPDVAVDEAGVVLTFEAAAETPDYPNSTFGLDPYDGGKAFSLRGGRAVELTMPLQGVTALSEFAFDISSSGTGPKAFSLFYSMDGGTTYLPIAENKQFDDMGDQKRNSYQFDLEQAEGVLGASLKLKFEFIAGNREGAGDYNESQGTVRLDNIRLSGVYNEDIGGFDEPNLLRYFIFSANDRSLVQQRQLPMSSLDEGGSLSVQLADGEYDVLFIAFRSAKGLLLPQALSNADEFYLGQHFDDHEAITYVAMVQGLVIDDAQAEEEVVLNRCYSLIEFEFTDAESTLQQVKRIEVAQLHDDFFYTPFGTPQSIVGSDTRQIIFSDLGGDGSRNIRFHQFLGLLQEGMDIEYEITAYDEHDDELNKVTISEVLQNNKHLRLTGKLLGARSGFSISLNSDWDEVSDREF